MTNDTIEGSPRYHQYFPPIRLPSLSVVMPAYNKAENVEAAILDALEAAASVAEDYEVVVVDDGSTDHTAAIVESLTAVYGDSVHLIRNEHNLGYGPTVRRALAAARMAWVLFADSDCQFDVSEVSLLVPLTDDADIVTGWRKDRKDPWLRRLNAHIFNTAARCFFGTRVKDIDCAFKLMRTSALQRLDLTANSAMINTELMYQARQHGLRVVELAVTHREREFGVASGGNPRVIARAIREFFGTRRRFNRPKPQRLRLHGSLVALVALIAGVAATYWTVKDNTVLAYGDAEAHLNISKRVVSGLTGGLAQLGSVWLPLPHMLMVPFVVDDGMWRTGIAGAAIGVPSLVLLAVMAYKLAYLLTGSVGASWLAPLVIVANPNTLYLSATPMTEVLLLALVTTSVYFLARWIRSDGTRNLVLTALFGGLATLSRYDGWALVCIEAVVVAVVATVRYRKARRAEGPVILFGMLAFAGVAGWLLWNQIVFADPLHFARSGSGYGRLPTYHDLGKSAAFWLEDVRIIVGTMPVGLAAAGLVLLLANSAWRLRLAPLLVAGAALTSFVCYVLSLYLGQASLILPRFAPDSSPHQLSNVRYGVQALLPVALFVAYLARRHTTVVGPLVAVIVLAQGVASVATGRVMAYEDGTRGLSSQLVSKGPDGPLVEDWMRHHYDDGLVLMDDYRQSIGPVESGVPMSSLIGVGTKSYWRDSLENPVRHARWIILQQVPTDAVWRGFNAQSRAILQDHFVEVYGSGTIHVYKRRPESPDFVAKRGPHLYLNERRWNPVGVDSYDLLEQSRQVIDDRLGRLATGGHNTVRTWCFDKDGGIREATLDKLAQTLHTAGGLGLRLICTLANYYPDFGGQWYFTDWGEDFFTSTTARTRYRDQVRRVLEYRDADGVRLADNAAILAWDLINEPRTNPGAAPGTVAGWTEEMAGFVGSIDQRHLVTVGGEGLQSGYPANPALSGPPGSDFATLCGVSAITLCSAHLFAQYLADPTDGHAIERLLQGWRFQAEVLHKPVLIGEVGYSLSDAADLTKREELRTEFYADVARAVSNNDLDGALLWNLGTQADQAFTLACGEPGSDRVLSAWSSIIPKNR